MEGKGACKNGINSFPVNPCFLSLQELPVFSTIVGTVSGLYLLGVIGFMSFTGVRSSCLWPVSSLCSVLPGMPGPCRSFSVVAQLSHL